jgi:hypothetical protein
MGEPKAKLGEQRVLWALGGAQVARIAESKQALLRQFLFVFPFFPGSFQNLS